MDIPTLYNGGVLLLIWFIALVIFIHHIGKQR